MKKHLWWVVLTALMGILLALCLRLDQTGKEIRPEGPLHFCFQADKAEIRISCWEDGTDWYVFLPSFADMDRMTAALRRGTKARLGDTELTDGMSCACFETDRAYPLRLGDGTERTLHFLRSANVASMFIRTETRSMERIHADKSRKERVEITVFLPEGEQVYHTPFTDRIRGHGNSTWDLEKKSYNLYLGGKADLFGMGASDKYVLVSNAIDDTNLRNRLVYDFANKVGDRAGFSPECEYVDLYLNGDYAGLYLLCEKPGIGQNRLEIDENSILFEVTCYGSAEDRQTFRTDGGPFVEIHSPEPVSAAVKDRLEAELREMQEALLSDNGVCASTGRNWEELIDIDSWARKYLVEEVFENADAVFFSQYYYQEPSETRIFAGPCWDYDGAAGMFPFSPNCFLAQRSRLNDSQALPWYAALWQKEQFRSRVTELYRTEFLPELEHLLADTIPEMTKRLQAATEMNRIRWYDVGDTETSITELKDYLEKHIAFLNSAWIDGVSCHTLTLKRSPGDVYFYYCVPEGQACPELPTPEEFGGKGEIWFREDNGVVFDNGEPVEADLTLTAYEP